MRSLHLVLGSSLLLVGIGCATNEPAPSAGREPTVLIVMDPLAKELACACVEGQGQRDYRKLAARLGAELKEAVAVEFSDDLAETLNFVGTRRPVIVVGEPSRVAHGAKQAGVGLRPVGELTDPGGSTTVTAIFVTRAGDTAGGLKDLAGRKVLFGVPEADEKHAAATAALRAANLNPPPRPEDRPSVNDAALDALDSPDSPPPVAVIPAFALPLLEGCGSIDKGALKIIAETAPAPFITAFVSDTIPPQRQARIVDILLGIKSDPEMLRSMESRDGFRPLGAAPLPAPRTRRDQDWPDWRGPLRDGRVPGLPDRLPETVSFVWKKPAMAGCLAGLSVADGRLIVAERDAADEYDVYRCLNAADGEPLWRVAFPARGQLEYGPSPRAAPVIHDGRAYLLGAFGGLRCVDMKDGSVLWERDLPGELGAELPTWGMCSPPLIADDLLIVNPGASQASLAALDARTGRMRWATPGSPAAYSAFIVGEFGGRQQVIGYDQDSLGGWDVKSGERLWKLVPPVEGDFNVPTPIIVDGGIAVSTENNGTRLYRFDPSGRIIPAPAGRFAGLSPDTATPVVTRGRLFGAHFGLYCLDLRDGLKPVWKHEDPALGDHASLFADDDRVLVAVSGELILLDAASDTCSIVSRLRVFDEGVEVYSHPALVGSRLYMRGGDSVVCLDLETK